MCDFCAAHLTGGTHTFPELSSIFQGRYAKPPPAGLALRDLARDPLRWRKTEQRVWCGEARSAQGKPKLRRLSLAGEGRIISGQAQLLGHKLKRHPLQQLCGNWPLFVIEYH